MYYEREVETSFAVFCILDAGYDVPSQIDALDCHGGESISVSTIGTNVAHFPFHSIKILHITNLVSMRRSFHD